MNSSEFVYTHKKTGWRKIFAFFGPAFLVSVGYIDPGNWATDIAGGSEFGFSLIWVLLMSNLMAIFLQSMASRLGVVRQRDLAQANKEYFPKGINFILYLFAEIAIIATDLAEVVGMAIGINLLTGLPILWGVVLTIVDTFFLLYLQRLGVRKVEAFILTLMGIIGISFALQIIIANPNGADIAKGFIPTIENSKALYIIVGIIGATIMPHNLYLHSGLVQTRKIKPEVSSIKKALRFNLFDSIIALNFAFLINAAILIVAAVAFYNTGHNDVTDIFDAHKLLEPLLGSQIAPILFAIALVASGQSSTITGTMAGQIIMEGYLNLRINPLLRRLITRSIAIIPTLFIVISAGESKINDFLILSQVILSLQLGFAIVPLIHFVSNKKTMGQFAIKWHEKILAWLIAGILVVLNIQMINNEIMSDKDTGAFSLFHFLFYFLLALFLGFLLYITFYPLVYKNKSIKKNTNYLHNLRFKAFNIQPFRPKNIVIALDFTHNDSKIISYALQQGNKKTQFNILHVVESPTSQFLKENTFNLETSMDKDIIKKYAKYIQKLGYKCNYKLGFADRKKEIIQYIKDTEADMLIIGSHGHKSYKDFIYGETINEVRHRVKIPILIVNV